MNPSESTEPKFAKPLSQILDGFSNRLAYRSLDTKALDISRSAGAGNLGDRTGYAEWASISNDPLVIANLVHTYITTLCSKLTSSPFRPVDDKLHAMAQATRLDSTFFKLYKDVLNDGYAYLALGVRDGMPIFKNIDARYIIFNGDDPSLKDSTEVLVFNIVPKTENDKKEHVLEEVAEFPEDFVEYDQETEKVITTYYKRKNDVVYMAVYDTAYEESEDPDEQGPELIEIPGITRIPVIRFTGLRVELSDKRYHYRGLYYLTYSVMKAMTLAGTKVQIRTATYDVDNYLVNGDAIANHEDAWHNTGTRKISTADANSVPIPLPVTPIEHDDAFLINAFNLWKSVLGEILGPIVASGSEAITREEVIARNETRDAIATDFLSSFMDSAEEVYRSIVMLVSEQPHPQQIPLIGGFIENAKRTKENSEIEKLYNLAKESGLNAQGFVHARVQNSDLPFNIKQQLMSTLATDPYASPVVLDLKNKMAKLTESNTAKDRSIALLKIQATQRLERQAEYVASQERIKQQELMFDQWKEEQAQTQEGTMAVLKDLLAKGDIAGAMGALASIKKVDKPLVVPVDASKQIPEYAAAVNAQVQDSLAPIQQAEASSKANNAIQTRMQRSVADMLPKANITGNGKGSNQKPQSEQRQTTENEK